MEGEEKSENRVHTLRSQIGMGDKERMASSLVCKERCGYQRTSHESRLQPARQEGWGSVKEESP